MQDQVIYFHRNGKVGMRFLTGPLRKARKEREQKKGKQKTIEKKKVEEEFDEKLERRLNIKEYL